jgi:hypothetical protein
MMPDAVEVMGLLSNPTAVTADSGFGQLLLAHTTVEVSVAFVCDPLFSWTIH